MLSLEIALTSPYAAVPFAQPELAPLQALLRLWEDAKRDAGGLPSRRRFTFEAMRPWLGHVAIWTVERSPQHSSPQRSTPLRFKASLIGMQLVEWDGQEGTGRYLDEIISETYRDAALARYVRVATSGTSYADMARFLAPHTTTATLHRLLLPCAEDGATVDAIITAIYRADSSLPGSMSPQNP